MAAVLQGQLVTVDAPHGGWDAFSSLDNMPPENAILLDNLIPSTGTVETRLGHIEFADVPTSEKIETLLDYNPSGLDGSSRLVAAGGGGIWDITDPSGAGGQAGPVGQNAGPIASAINELAPEGTFTSSRWQGQNFTKADESGILILTNGVDPVQIYDGAALTEALFTEEDGAPMDPQPVFVGSLSFKGRVFYWKENDNAFWYAQAGSYQGYLQEFDLGNFSIEGGSLLYCSSWTQQDSGDGKDDFFVAGFTTGEVLIYQGDDPETVGFWEMIGRYTMGEPLSIRGATRYGADTIIMTEEGYVNLASIVQQGVTSDVPQFSRMITGAIQRRTRYAGVNTADGKPRFGWQAKLFPKQGLFLFNVPLSDTSFEQHVLNTVTMRWCRFRGLNMICLEAHNDRLFGGGSDGKVYALLEGTSDDGREIQFASIPAYQYLGDPGRQKHLTAIQILSTHTRPEYISVEGYADYDVPKLVPVLPPPDLSQGIWSVNPASPSSPIGSYWDEDYWATEDVPFTTKGWQNISAYGYAISYLVRFAKLNDSVTWRSTTLRFFNTGAQ